jgi:hypothetical protein
MSCQPLDAKLPRESGIVLPYTVANMAREGILVIDDEQLIRRAVARRLEVVEQALETTRLRREVRRLRATQSEPYDAGRAPWTCRPTD